MELLDQTFFDNNLLQWIIAGSVAVVTLLTLRILQCWQGANSQLWSREMQTVVEGEQG